MENIDINWGNCNPITATMNIAVSGLLHREDGIAVCVMVEDNGKSAEFRLNPMLPGEILMNNGYTQNQVEEILSYLTDNIDNIVGTARTIDPMKAFMK